MKGKYNTKKDDLSVFLSISLFIVWFSCIVSITIWLLFKLPQPVLDKDAPLNKIVFCEERAVRDLAQLTAIGPHVEGTEDGRKAIEFLLHRVREIQQTAKVPVHIKVQNSSGYALLVTVTIKI